MPRSTPTTLALPPFSGATRRLILIYVSVFFLEAILNLILPAPLHGLIFGHLPLTPLDVVHGQVWQLVTYSFVPLGITGSLFAVLSLWFIGSMLEDVRGSRWLYELFFTSAIGGAVLASLISFTHLFGLRPTSIAAGPISGIFGMLVAVAVLMGDIEFFLFFLFRIKAKYLVAIYVLIDIAQLLKTDNAFEALIELSGGLCGFLLLQYFPRRGVAHVFTERWYALRNDYYRAKRRRAARKFEVYMSKQGRDVKFDKEGRYIDPDKDPNDKSWMN
jgi:membrane associated rhomboid family serine protease